jgi:Holliday junction DNA helicase RuvA
MRMIARISGTVMEIALNHAIIDVQGLGYKVFLTADTLHTLKNGKTATFWTYLAVREDALDLYGFPTKTDQRFFELLISVSGIGPKSALNILSLASPATLMSAIRTGSTSHLTKISGIGKKTAEKIILELSDKVGTIVLDTDSKSTSAGLSSDLDAIEALTSLGYDADEARDALKKISKEISDVGAKVKAALKVLG